MKGKIEKNIFTTNRGKKQNLWQWNLILWKKEKKKTIKEQNQNEIVECKQKN